MGITKTNLYTEQHNKQAEFFKALGHPARLKIIYYLMAQKSCICGDIVEAIELSQPTITRHLQVLKEANIIQGTIEGNKVCYCLNAEGLLEVKAFLLRLEEAGVDGGCC
jgi:ArsR family transcriptional regulator, arsenate/arsenite/antimonite-responsive transcriptional repressor